MKTRQESYQEIIANLSASTSDIKGVAIISTDGLMLESSLPGNMQKDKVAAISAAMLGLSKKSVSEMSFGILQEIQVKADGATYVILSADATTVLAVVAAADANIGLVNIESRNAAKQIAQI